MSRKNIVYAFPFVGVAAIAVSISSASVFIPMVPVGSLSNAADPTTGAGSVSYNYNIGQTEVTNAQYAAFLNAVAATDTNGLYSPAMAGSFGGIIRSGLSGSFTYSTVVGRASNPVNFVSFWDAARFANWLHNGQPTGLQNAGTTEDGAYTMTPDGVGGNTIIRNAGWQWAVASQDEWYKAAYFQPASQGGDSDNYWLYGTSTNTITPSMANYNNVIGNTVSVGSYAANFYGAFDMTGNVWEWNDTIIGLTGRGLRGGSFVDDSIPLLPTVPQSPLTLPTTEFQTYGFRVSQIPGPGSVALVVVCGIGALRRRRSR